MWRWWDGWRWGPPAGAPPRTDVKTLAILSQLGFVLGGFILPLVILLVAGEDRYVKHHASESLNLEITFYGVWIGGFALFFVAGIATAGGGRSAGAAFGALFLVLWALMMVTMVARVVLGIVAAVKASRGEWYRYPLCIRLVPGAAPQGTPPITL